MGYSLGVRFKNEKEQQAMYEFYLSNTDIIEALSVAEGRSDAERYMDLHFELSYAPKVKHLLGYDGSSGIPYYFELLLAWMAVKSNYRDKSGEPFLYYDNEKIKVNKSNFLNLQVDERGIQSLESSLMLQKEQKTLSFKLFQVTNFEQYAKTVETLFNGLEERWQTLQLNQNKQLSKKPKM